MGGIFSRSLIAKILAILVGAVITAAFLLTVFQVQQSADMLQEKVDEQGEALSHLLSESLTFDVFLADSEKVNISLSRGLISIKDVESAVILLAGAEKDDSDYSEPAFAAYSRSNRPANTPANIFLPEGKMVTKRTTLDGIIYFPKDITLKAAEEGEEDTFLGKLVLGISTKQIVSARRRTFALSALTSLTLVVILVAICFLLIHRTFQPLRLAVQSLKAMASGDLTEEIPTGGQDEIGILLKELDRFSSALKEVLRNTQEAEVRIGQVVNRIIDFSDQLSSGVSRSSEAFQQILGQIKASDEDVRQILGRTEKLSTIAEEASSSATEMTASAEEVARNAERTFRDVEENVTSINEISHTMSQVTLNTRELGDLINGQQESVVVMVDGLRQIVQQSQSNQELAVTTSERAKEESQLVLRLNKNMRELVEQADDSIGQIRRMAMETKNIGEILDLIKEIGEQVSLLSINASIIAAQSSGAEGKAFSVVASEIKNLSSRTLASTSDIANIIKKVQGVAQETENTMNEMISRIHKSAEEVSTSKKLTDELQKHSEDAKTTAQKTRESADNLLYKADVLKTSSEKVGVFSRSVLRSSEDVTQSSASSLQNLENMMSFAEEVKNATEEQSRGTAIIGESVGSLVGMIEEFNRASRNLQKETSGIRKNTEAIHVATNSNQKLSDEMRDSVNLLQETSQRLHNIISRFKI